MRDTERDGRHREIERTELMFALSDIAGRLQVLGAADAELLARAALRHFARGHAAGAHRPPSQVAQSHAVQCHSRSG